MWGALDRAALRASRTFVTSSRRVNAASSSSVPSAPPPTSTDAVPTPDHASTAQSAEAAAASLSGSDQAPATEERRRGEAGPSRPTLSTPTTDEDIERMWDAVINRTSEVNALRKPRPSPRGRDLLSRSTPSPRGPHGGRYTAPLRETHLVAELEKTLFGLGAGTRYAPAAGLGAGGRFGLGLRGGPRGAGALRRMREEEDDVELARMEDEIKEEMSMIETDAELVEWARARVFTPTAEARVESAVEGSISASSTDASADASTHADASANAGAYPRTYPKILAHLIHVARVSYRNPALALFFFQHARARSLESYLSGCLASAYNEHVRTLWECERDLAAVEAAVAEMAANAVRWDRGTRRAIDDIVASVSAELAQAARAGHGGPDATGRWGPDVYATLARLEGLVLKDIQNDEKRFEDNKRRKRDQRRAEWYESRMGGYAPKAEGQEQVRWD
ncbi:hypothetical protein Q5752_002383 [Cryptotrichosporon argae]